jgi:probable phosphoglycerate mutase
MDHTLLLARHGITAWNAEKRLQGGSEVPLSPEGRRQAEALAAALATETLHRALVSALGRAQATAAAVAAARTGPPFETDRRLDEVNLGEWEGRLESELAGDPAHEAWRADPVRSRPPGGENALDVARRVAPLLDELARMPSGSRILVVGHQFTNAVIRCLLTGTPLDQVRSRYSQPAEIHRVDLPFRP